MFLSVFDLSVPALRGKNWHLFSPAVTEKRGCQGFSGLIPSTFLDKYFLKNWGKSTIGNRNCKEKYLEL
jgi:hypothetical protein